MLIRDVTLADHGVVRNLLVAAFQREDEATLVERLRRSNDAVIDIVADNVGPTVGYALFSKLAAPFPALALAPVAVAAEARRNGVGAKLINHGLKEAARGEWRAIFVLGDPTYYGRFGFDVDLARGFDSPYAGVHFMVAPLGGNLPTRTGVLHYARPFAGVS